ncbi:TRAP transporter small permease [Cellulomonas shaoxiangyii]|uniref:TRAP transporter small permease n=1 Tax=Cellulomonas shaoxiangyii TaxID=2566013 RepID=A0A4P7SIU8_9CELL|nr:TRAP transporter small permease [Cellulomonas shaoxiangyii]QCB94022.1 TRAP transporter small permease [Cellulomonas shaoxiangyii]TGY85789.1 TRAP transporter small permease [Cellulomonas shaoxiangyii]
MSTTPPRGPHGAGAEETDEGAAPVGRGFYHALDRVEVRVAQVFLVLMTVLVLVSAIARTAGSPVSWAVDLATFAFAWTVFVSADIALRRDKMVNIGILAERFPAGVQRGLAVLNWVLIIVFLAAMVVTGLQLVQTTSDRSFSGLPWLSYSWVTLAVPVGCLLMLYTSCHKLRGVVRAQREVTR